MTDFAQEIATLAGYTKKLLPCTDDEFQNLKDLVNEHWSTIKRACRGHSTGDGLIPIVPLGKLLCQELALTLRDEPNVMYLLSLVCQRNGPDLVVALPTLWSKVARQRDNANWRMRFRAKGCVDSKIQNYTTGVEKSANDYRLKYQGPPYAISGDSDHMHDMLTDYFSRRSEWMKRGMMKHALTYPHEMRCLTQKEFRHALHSGVPDKYGSSDREVTDLLAVLDPTKTNKVNVDEFIKLFGFEFLKQKSMRNTVGVSNNDGTTNTFQWAASLQASKTKRDLIEDLRIRRTTPRRVLQSRASYLRQAHGKQQRDYNVAVESRHFEVIQSALNLRAPPYESQRPYLNESQRQELRNTRFLSPTLKGSPRVPIPPMPLPAALQHRRVLHSGVKPTPRDMGNVGTPRPQSATKPPLTPRPPTAR